MKRLAIGLGVCLATSVAMAQTVTVDGYRVNVGKPMPMAGPAVAVDFRLFAAELGPNKGAVASGYAISSLPSEWYKVTITIRFWDVYAQRKDIFERARATVVLDRPKPGRRVKWRALLWSPHKRNELEPFANPRPIHTIHVEFTPQLPKAAAEEF